MLAALLALVLAFQTPTPVTPTPVTRSVDRAERKPGPVILISLDGFRADYLKRGLTPRLSALAHDGAWSPDGMRPAFPSLTFPNHYTLVTGLYPDHHGVVANTMDDPAVAGDTHFTLSTQDATADRRWWDGAEPIWVSAHKAGLKTGIMYWPGSEAEIGGVRPDRWAHFDAAVSFPHRVDVMLDWLKLPQADRPDFLTLYFDEPDHTGHHDGPASPQVDAKLREVDAAIGRLVDGLKALGLYDAAELVIVADHGMAATAPDRVAYVDDWVGPALGAVHQVTGGPVEEINLQGAEAAAAERAILQPHPHVRCWRKADIPAALHYGTNPRVPQLVCLADVGWEVTTREAATRIKRFSVGEHGYDPAAPEMRALFIVHGPAFRPGHRQPVFDNVDVQPLLAHLLGISAPPGDGGLAPLAGSLRQP